MKDLSSLLYPLAKYPRTKRIFLALIPNVLLMLVYPVLPKIAFITPGILAFPMVIFTVWLGGFIPGMLSMLSLSTFIISYVWADQFRNADFTSPAHVRAFLFLFSCTFFISLISALQRSLEKTKLALKLRDEFVSTASHELRTPITALTLQMEVLKSMHQNDPATLQVIETTNKHLQRLHRVVTASLDLSMLDTGQISINPVNCTLNQILESSIESLRHQIEETGTRVHFESTPPISGTWDRTRIEQVFVNLLHNAIKYGKGNPIYIKLEEAYPEATISILDKGMGIAQSEMDIIFDRYQRGKSADAIPGIGLGLYLSRSIVELHNGSIEVESKLGVGSNFTVRLPINKEGPAEARPGQHFLSSTNQVPNDIQTSN